MKTFCLGLICSLPTKVGQAGSHGSYLFVGTCSRKIELSCPCRRSPSLEHKLKVWRVGIKDTERQRRRGGNIEEWTEYVGLDRRNVCGSTLGHLSCLDHVLADCNRYPQNEYSCVTRVGRGAVRGLAKLTLGTKLKWHIIAMALQCTGGVDLVRHTPVIPVWHQSSGTSSCFWSAELSCTAHVPPSSFGTVIGYAIGLVDTRSYFAPAVL